MTEQLFSNILLVKCHYIRSSSYYVPCIVHLLLKTVIFSMNGTLYYLVILPDELILCGDLNLYLDVPPNNNTIQFLQSLDACDLIQHEKEPTHCQGHTLDVVITRGSNNYIETINVVDPVLCNQDNVILRDHYAIMAHHACFKV